MSDAAFVLEAHARSAHAVHFTRDGTRLVTAGEGGVRTWTVPGFRAERAGAWEADTVTALAFTSTGERMAARTRSGEVRVGPFPVRADAAAFTVAGQALAALGPDGDHLATVSTANELVLRDGHTGAVLRSIGALDKRQLALAFASSGLFLFVGGTGPIRRIALPDGTLDGVLEGHRIGVACLTPSTNPAILGSTGLDGTLRFWTVVSGAEVSCVKLPEAGALELAFAPDARSVAVSTSSGVLRLTAPDGELIERHECPGARGVAFSPDGKHLACAAADGRVRVWGVA